MAQEQTKPRLFLPALQPFYYMVIPLSWLVIRGAVGWKSFDARLSEVFEWPERGGPQSVR
jgi:hypothetical protein